MGVLVVALLRVAAPDRRPYGLDDHYLAAVSVPHLVLPPRSLVYKRTRLTGESTKVARLESARDSGQRGDRVRAGPGGGRRHEVILWARSEGSRPRGAAWRMRRPVVTELSELAGCPVVVEAVSEDVEAKRGLYEQLADVLPDDAVLATTTSSLSVAELAKASGRPDRFAALHVFNPVEKMQLVELSFPAAASGDTKKRLHELCEHLDKTAVEVPDAAGLRREQAAVPVPLRRGAPARARRASRPEAIDTCMKLGAGHPMGPLAPARLRRARRGGRDRRVDRRRGARPRARADRRGQARPKGRRRLLRVPAEEG